MTGTAKPPAPPPSDASARVDHDLVASTYRKVVNKQELTRAERTALKRHEKEKDERLRWQHYASIPQKHLREMSVRQTKVINEQATRHGIPFGGATINLPAVVRAVHDFLADNSVKLARDDDALMQGNGSAALERSRISQVPRGVIPETAKYLTAAIDLGKYITHWIVVAWSEKATGHVVDYGRIEVASEDLGVEQALMVALREFRDLVTDGWPTQGSECERKKPDRVWIDSGYMTDVVYTFVREAGERFQAAVGRGASQERHQWYNRPTQTGSVVRKIGEGYHINWLRSSKNYLCEVNADHWKTWVHQRLTTPVGQPGAMSLFQAAPPEHFALAKHLTAETKTEEFVTGKGVVVKWERLRRQNHWFDALCNACAAGHYCGVRLIDEVKVPRPRMSLQELMGQAANRPTAQQLADRTHARG